METLYLKKPVGSLLAHPLKEVMLPAECKLPAAESFTKRDTVVFLHMLEVYINDFIGLAQTAKLEAVHHCSQATLHGIHNIFLLPHVMGHIGKDPIS